MSIYTPMLAGIKMAETVGSLIDKIAIFELKRYHMLEQTTRDDADKKHIRQCQMKINVLTEQRDDLVQELNELLDDIISGRKVPKIYRQFKMYNDPRYRKKK